MIRSVSVFACVVRNSENAAANAATDLRATAGCTATTAAGCSATVSAVRATTTVQSTAD